MIGRLITKEDRLQARKSYVPAGAYQVCDSDIAAAYIFPDKYRPADRTIALGFVGTAGKPALYTAYRKYDDAAAAVVQFLLNIGEHHARRRATAKAKAEWTNPLQVGTILYTCWGYDQTNVEFYVVTRVSGRRTWIREIAADFEATGFMQGKTWPKMPIEMHGDETMHIAQPSGSRGVYLKISDSIHAYVDEGKTHHTSSYA